MTAGGTGERGDRAGLATRDLLDHLVERDLAVGEQEGAAGNGRDQCDGVAVGKGRVPRGVLAVDRVEQPVGLVAEVELRPDVADGRGVDLLLRPARAFPQSSEKPHRYRHASSVAPMRETE